jgi:uncharacterized protein
MQLTKELFVIPHEDNFILYAPLKRAVAEVNGDMISLLKRLKAGKNLRDLDEWLRPLLEIGIVTNGETPISKYVPKTDYTPTTVTLIPSFDCNLRCTYCFSKAGETPEKIMDIEIAKAAIDLVIKNSKMEGEKEVGLAFHGGGEPFLERNIPLVKKSVEYFKQQAVSCGLNPKVAAVTNGLIAPNSLEWIVSEFHDIDVSCDGPEDIQNRQRPLKNGGKSFPWVMRTVDYLESRGFNYGLRATVTKESVSRMPEIISFFNTISPSLDHYKLEPVFECGRCMTSKTEAPKPEDFIKYMVEAKAVGRNLGKTVSYSGSIIDSIFDSFCSTLDKGFFCVLPDGNVTSCLEVYEESDPRAKIFFTGNYDFGSQSFVFLMDRVDKLRSRNVDNIPYCRDCFAKYHCAGECPSRCYTQTGSLFDPSANPRCQINREIIKEAFVERLKGGEKNDSKF